MQKKLFDYLPLSALQTFQLLRFVSTLGIGFLLAKVFGLSTSEIAIYEILLFLSNFLSFFWIAGGIKALLSQYPREVYPFEFLLNITFLLFLFGCFAGGGLYTFQEIIVHYLTPFDNLEFVGLVSLILVFSAPSSLVEYAYLLYKKDASIIRYGFIIFGLQILSVLLPLSFGLGVAGIFQFMLGWSMFKFLWLIFLLYSLKRSVKKESYSCFNFKKLQKIGWLMFPLSLHTLIGGGMQYVDGFIVSSYFEEQGIFAIFRYGARELPLVSILVAALVATYIPKVVGDKKTSIVQMKKEVNKLAIWMFPLTYCLMLLSPLLFPIVYNADFSQSAHIFNIYLLIISSRLLLPQVLIYAHQRNFILVVSAIIEVIVNLILSLYLVKDYGLEGIAFATVIAYLVNKVILIIFNYFQLGVSLSTYINLKTYVFCNLLLLLSWWVSRQIY